MAIKDSLALGKGCEKTKGVSATKKPGGQETPSPVEEARSSTGAPRSFGACMASASRVGGYGGSNRVMNEKLTCSKAKKPPHKRQRCLIAWKCLQNARTIDNQPVKDLLHSWIRDHLQV